MIIKRINIYFLFLTLIFLASCGENSVYEKSFSFNNHAWDIKEKKTFEVEIKDVSKIYDINFTLRTTTDFDYRNLWVYLTTTLPTKQTERKPYQFRISDDQGKWIGTNSGSIVESQLSFNRIKLPKPGKYIFTLEHGLEGKTATEVVDITLSIRESKEEGN